MTGEKTTMDKSILSIGAPAHPRSNHRLYLLIALVLSIFPFVIHCQESITDLGKSNLEQRALKILKSTPLIDGHNDLLILIRDNYKNRIYGPEFKDKFEKGGLLGHVDIPRIKAGKSGGAFWAAYMPCPENTTDLSDANYASTVRATFEQLDLFKRLGDLYPKYFTPTKNSHEAKLAFEKGLTISPTAIEGLHQIGNSVSTLRSFYQLGVRYATLTWNCHNAYADSALTSTPQGSFISKPLWNGVSPRGRELIYEMNRLGMIVDLSHVSQDTMRDVLAGEPHPNDWKGSLAPPIFSHSSAYALCPHPRNVPDDVLQLVKKRNSLVMVNIAPSFISCTAAATPGSLPVYYPANATLHQYVRHIKHIGDLIGYDHVGVGTDFDGIDDTPTGIEDVSKFPALVVEMLNQGISDRDAKKVVGGNLLRVWTEVDKVAADLQKKSQPLEDELK